MRIMFAARRRFTSRKRAAPGRKRRTFKRGAASTRRTFSRKTTTRSRVVSKKRKLLPSLSHQEVNRNVIYPRTHMKLKSELVIGNVYFPGKAWLNLSILNCFGSLMFPMNLINTPGLWNIGAGGVNGASLCDTKSMPSFMGSSAQASRYARALVTGSSITISIKVMQEAFTYDPTLTGTLVTSRRVSTSALCLSTASGRRTALSTLSTTCHGRRLFVSLVPVVCVSLVFRANALAPFDPILRSARLRVLPVGRLMAVIDVLLLAVLESS